MNKYQEALKRLKQETAPVTYCADFDKEKCINILQELVDKATPKKVSMTDFHHIDVNIKRTKCPQCSMYIYGIVHISVINFCNHCGQALDWSDEYDK